VTPLPKTQITVKKLFENRKTKKSPCVLSKARESGAGAIRRKARSLDGSRGERQCLLFLKYNIHGKMSA